MFYGWLLKIAYRNRKIDVMQLSLSLLLQLLWRGWGTEDTPIINRFSAVAAGGRGNGRHINHKPVICLAARDDQ